MLNWILNRFKERTSLDGAMLIVAGLAILFFKPFAGLFAYFAIGYGAWTIFMKDKGD